MNINQKAEILSEALPYIQKYKGKTVVVKYGGNAMTCEELKLLVMRDIVLLHNIGVNIVLVHGGGPEINDTLKKMNIESRFVGGLRQTDAATIEVVQMVLAGKVNKNLVSLIEGAGGKAIGLSGIDGSMIRAERVSAELGYVGEVTSVDPTPIFALLERGYIPVISTVARGVGDDPASYNINADTAAAAIASKLDAEALITMTDIKGILRDINNPDSLISKISVSEVEALIADGTVNGGMIPKVRSCVDTVRAGVRRVFIIDGRVPHAILIEMLSNEGIGTMFYGLS